jgi:hypothetical protein
LGCFIIEPEGLGLPSAQVKGIPFLVFDAGGVLEMFDPREFEDNVVFEPTLAALKRKLAAVVAHGRIKTVELAEHITTGRQQWLQWHADLSERLPQLVQVLMHQLPPCVLFRHCGTPVSASACRSLCRCALRVSFPLASSL